MKTLSARAIAEILGNRLKKIRKERGITQEEVAQYVDRNWSAIENWETGATSPNLCYLILLAEFYGVDINYFLNDLKEAMESDA